MSLCLLITALRSPYSGHSLPVSGEHRTTISRERWFSSRTSLAFLRIYSAKMILLACGSAVRGVPGDVILIDTGIDCKSNIAIIGSFMVTALLASTYDKVYQLRQGALEEFRRLLQRSERRFDFAALPLLRLNLLVERFSDSRASPESSCE